jgi:deoxyribodipyrimidine photo-lyase
MTEKRVPAIPIRDCNDAPLRPAAASALYWMIAARRSRGNFALDRAIKLARELGKPLGVLEALRCGHHWARDRIHRFALAGTHENLQAFAGMGVLYYSWVEPEKGAGKGLLEALGVRRVRW